MKSLFKVTLLATTMAVARMHQSLLLLKLQNLLTADSKAAFKMTIRNQLMHWVLRWVVTWKTLLKNKKTGHQTG